LPVARTVRKSKVLIERDPGDETWVTYVPALGRLSTYGDTREQALAQAREAILGYLEAAAKEGLAIASESDVDIEVATP
jgi:predicted RNase H-like HicB family nuclease